MQKFITVTELAKAIKKTRVRVHQMISEKKITPDIKNSELFLFSQKNADNIVKNYFKEELDEV